MGLGSTAKNVQKLANLAEKLYAKVNEVLERLAALSERVEGASEDIEAVRREQREQRVLLEALAREQDLDIEAVLADVAHPGSEDTAETTGEDGSDETGNASGPASDVDPSEAPADPS